MMRLQRDEQIEPVTISEAIERHGEENFGQLKRLVPGSWIDANFNVWIGAPEDNLAWDLLAEARDYYDRHAQPRLGRAAKDRLGRVADRRGQRLELVVRAGASLGQRSRLR